MNIWKSERHRLDVTWKFLRAWGLPFAYEFLPKEHVELKGTRYSVHTFYVLFIRFQLALPEN